MHWKKMLLGLLALVVISTYVLSNPIRRSPFSHARNTQVAIDESTWYRVLRVVDGDTLRVDIDGADTSVRLIGLDTPETVDPRAPVECFGKEASEKAQQILSGTSVRLELDPSQGMFDKYGRVLAYVYAPANVKQEGILLNEVMITEGYGHEYTYDLPYKYQTLFKAAEEKARADNKGLWAPGACL